MQPAIQDGAERRRFARHLISLPAKARRANGGTFAAITIVDVSVGGMQTLGAEPFSIGTEILVYLPGLAPKKACVVWQRDGRTGSQFDTVLHSAVVDHLARQFA